MDQVVQEQNDQPLESRLLGWWRDWGDYRCLAAQLDNTQMHFIRDMDLDQLSQVKVWKNGSDLAAILYLHDGVVTTFLLDTRWHQSDIAWYWQQIHEHLQRNEVDQEVDETFKWDRWALEEIRFLSGLHPDIREKLANNALRFQPL